MIRRGKEFLRTCQDFEQDLVLFYYGELSEPERSKVDTHVQDCQSCALYLKELGALLPTTVKADEPLPVFWDNYSREMRGKLDEISRVKTWWKRLAAWFQPWPVPAFAMTVVLVLALSLTFGKTLWRDKEEPTDEEVLVEMLPMAENLEFFTTMEVLDAMDFLESLGNNPQGSA
jgi:putative zinc finger protein